MAGDMFEGDRHAAALGGPTSPGNASAGAAERGEARTGPQVYGTIVIIGGGCYGSYYLRQLGRAANAGAIRWERLIVVDRDPACRVAHTESRLAEVVIDEWAAFLARFLDNAAAATHRGRGDAIVPSPLMPHLLFDWVRDRARMSAGGRSVSVAPLDRAPTVPWQRGSPNGETHYVSFAEWMCPINCIEPARCPHTRGERSWSLPPTIERYVASERAAGRALEGPFVFHCAHRTYGVGMLDVADVLAADRGIAELGAARATAFLVGTASHCHGALQRIVVGA